MTTGEFQLRRAIEHDAKLLAELGAKTFWQAYRTEVKLEQKNIRDYIEKAFQLETIESELAEAGTRYLIAERENQPAGFAKLVLGGKRKEIVSECPLEISRIYLLEEFWGTGLGEKLLKRCFEEGRQNGCDTIWLSVWENNHRAIRFYKKHGFEYVGEHVFWLASAPEIDQILQRTL